MNDIKDIKETLKKILLEEMSNLDLSLVPGIESRRQNLIKATEQLTSIVREFDNYSNIPRVFEIRLRNIASEINFVWNDLNKEEGFFGNKDDE